MKTNKKILFAVTNIAFLIRQLNWVKAVEEEGRWESVIYSTISEVDFKKICKEKKIRLSSRIIYSPTPKNKGILWLLNSIIYNLSKIHYTSLISFPFITLRHFLILRSEIRVSRRVIRENDISIMMLPDSSPAYSAPVLANAARKENVTILTNPLDRDSPNGYAMIYKTDETLRADRSVGWLVGKLYPKWLIEYTGIKMLRIPPAEIVAHEFLGIASPKPWNTFGFLEDIVIVGNDVQKKFYERTGVKEDNIYVIGAPEQDSIFSMVRNYHKYEREILSEFAFPSSKPILLCALPQTHWVSGRPEAEFQNHNEMIDVWMESLSAQNNYNIIVSLHPSMPIEQFKYLEASNIKIAKTDIVNFMPICSIFVACLSSTIHLAIALGKPVINYDVYRYSLEIEAYLFKEAGGTVTVHNRTDFESVIKQITMDNNYCQLLTKRQEDIAGQWGIIDGQAIKRLTSFLDSTLLKN